MKNLSYTIVLDPADEGGFNVSVPALPGCVTQGDTYEEAIAMAQDAITVWLETLTDLGEPIPEEPSNYAVQVSRVRVTLPKAV